jgi:hypothetical protein
MVGMRNPYVLPLVPLVLVTILASCGQPPPQPTKKVEQNTIQSLKFSSPNNNSFGIDEIVVDGGHYLVLNDQAAIAIIKKAETSSSITFVGPVQAFEKYGVDVVYIDGAAYLVLQNAGKASAIIAVPSHNQQAEQRE